MSYAKIYNLYKCQEILLFKECYALEKIDGTSAHIFWDGSSGNIRFFSGAAKHEAFVSLFDQSFLKEVFRSTFGDSKVIVYGEAFGAKVQGMSATYGKDLKFIAFDIKIDNHFLSVPQSEDIANKLNLEFVHYKKISTDLSSIDAERDADSEQAIRNGIGPGKIREGVVLRPLIEVIKNNGERICAKHKRVAFTERKTSPKVNDPEMLKVLTEASEIADEWVVPMRLEHILQKLPEATDMEHTPLVIKTMIQDVYTEAKGEIIESKEVSSAIGKKTAQLWKKRVMTINKK